MKIIKYRIAAQSLILALKTETNPYNEYPRKRAEKERCLHEKYL